MSGALKATPQTQCTQAVHVEGGLLQRPRKTWRREGEGVRRWGLLNYVAAGSLAADVMVPLQFSGYQVGWV